MDYFWPILALCALLFALCALLAGDRSDAMTDDDPTLNTRGRDR